MWARVYKKNIVISGFGDLKIADVTVRRVMFVSTSGCHHYGVVDREVTVIGFNGCCRWRKFH